MDLEFESDGEGKAWTNDGLGTCYLLKGVRLSSSVGHFATIEAPLPIDVVLHKIHKIA